MIPVTLTQGVTDGMADMPPNHTLEDVAEEILNGMFCTYEPPPPVRKPKKRGILRAPKMFRRNRSDQSTVKSVRWSDTHDDEEEEDAKNDAHHRREFHCNIASACIEAGIEAGCFSPNDNSEAKVAKESEAKTRSKKSKARSGKKLTEEVVFDEEGNPKSLLSGKVVAPPSPPAPKAKETFVPQLCGVKINCGDDEDHMEKMAKSNREGPSKTYHRPKQEYDYEDELDNSLVDEDDEEDEDDATIEERHKQQHQAILKRRMKKLREKQEKQRRKKAKESKSKLDEESDWDDDRASTASRNSSFFRRVFTKKGTGAEELQLSARGRATTSRSPSRSPSPGRRNSVSLDDDDEEELDAVQMVRAEGKQKKLSQRLSTDDDWDESLPIIPVRQQQNDMQRATTDKNATQNYRQQSTTNRANIAATATRSKNRDPSPGITRSRSRSVDDKEEVKSSRWSLPVRSKSRNSRSKSPSRARSSSPSRQTDCPDQEPVRVLVMNGRQGSLTQKAMENFNYMHPAHQMQRNFGDCMERDSMIMAHRRGMDGTMSSVAGAESDHMDRQSFITAHRQGFADKLYGTPSAGNLLTHKVQNGTIHPMSQSGYRDYDDMLERQSFITQSRQDFDMAPRTRACGLMDSIIEDDTRPQIKCDPIRVAGPVQPVREESRSRLHLTRQEPSEATARDCIHKTPDAFREGGLAPPKYFPPQAISNLQQGGEGSCCMQYCMPKDSVSCTEQNFEGPSWQHGQILAQRSQGIDPRLQAQQQAQLQQQYYDRVQAQQANRASVSKNNKKAKQRGRRQKSSFALPFFRRSRSRSPAPPTRTRSRSRSPSSTNHPQRRSRSLDPTDCRRRMQASPLPAAQMRADPNALSYSYPDQPSIHEQQLFYQQQLAMQQHLTMQQQLAHQQLAHQQAGQSSLANSTEAEAPQEDFAEQESSWEERTKQAWERLRSGLAFETAKEATLAENKSEGDVHETATSLSDGKAESRSEEKSDDVLQCEPPSLLQSALAMLSSTSAKDETKEESNQTTSQDNSAVPQNDTSSAKPNQPVPTQPYSLATMPMYPYQMPKNQAQLHQYPPRSMQMPYHPMSAHMPPGGPPLHTANRMSMSQLTAHQMPHGIIKPSSFDNRRVSFGERMEHTFENDQSENMTSPGKKKVFKGAKIITGLFGRGNIDQNNQTASKEQSRGLQQSHTKSTDLSSCPSNYTLSEEWDGGPYLYSAGPVSPHVQTVDTLSHIRLHTSRGNEGVQDPSGLIAI